MKEPGINTDLLTWATIMGFDVHECPGHFMCQYEAKKPAKYYPGTDYTDYVSVHIQKTYVSHGRDYKTGDEKYSSTEFWYEVTITKHEYGFGNDDVTYKHRYADCVEVTLEDIVELTNFFKIFE